eukprot:453262-Rhodomonas_salina.1
MELCGKPTCANEAMKMAEGVYTPFCASHTVSAKKRLVVDGRIALNAEGPEEAHIAQGRSRAA